MNFKLCFAQQIHRSPKVPDSYQSLRDIVQETFKDALPKNFVLSYLDLEGDRVQLTSEEDFKSMMEIFSQQNTKAVKIFITEEGNDEIPDHFKGTASQESNQEPVHVLLGEKSENEIHAEENLKEVPLEEKKIEEPKPENLEETKAGDVLEDDRIDLTDKKALRAFIVQTIEESLPQILSNCLKQRVVAEKKNFEQFDIVKGIKNVAGEITSRVDKFIRGEREGLNAKFSRTEKVVPEVVTTNDEQIAVTVLLKNKGTETFPPNTFLQNVGGIYGDVVQIPSLEPRKQFSATLLLKSPKTAGNYISKWRFGYIDEKDENKQFGDEYEFKVTIIEKKYSKEVHEKAGVLKELIPQCDINTFLEFISKQPKKPVELLIEEFLAAHPSI